MGNNVIEITKDNFESEVLGSDVPVLVDFWAVWCGPCKMLAPVLEELAEDMNGKMEIVKVDVDQEGDLAMKFGIMSVPTMIVFKDGEAVKQISGYQAKGQLLNILNPLL